MITAALLFTLALAGPWGTECQEPPTKPVDDSKASNSKASNSKPTESKRSGNRPSQRESGERKSGRAIAGRHPQELQSNERRFLQTSGELASRLRSESRDAFERGLLPLADYSEQLALALKMEVAVADLRGQKIERATALAAHASQLEAAAGQLQQFNQPAARGWRADLAQADFLAAQAAALATTNPENAANRAEALRLVNVQAQKHYQLRLSDFQNGLATLRDLSRAASSLTDDISDPETADAALPSLIDYQARMQQILSDTEELARRGADGGRIDHVHEAQFELNRSTMLIAGVSKDKQTVSTAFQVADLAAQELLTTQSRLHDSGTAPLFDMAHTLSQWQELHRQAGQADFEVPESSNTQQQNQLSRLVQLADQQSDLRGRIAADVTMIHSLKALTDLRRLESESRNAENRHTEGNKTLNTKR